MSIQTHFSHSTGFSEGFGFSVLTGSLEGSSQQRAVLIPPGGAGTFRNFKVWLSAAPGSGKSLTYTIQKNNVDTSLSVTISGGSTSGSVTGVDVHFADGDLIDASWSRTGGAVTVGLGCALEYEPDVDGTMIFGCGNGGGGVHSPALSGGFWSPSSTFRGENLIGVDGTITSLTHLSRTTPSGANTFEIALYKNGTKQDGSGGTVDTRCIITSPALTATKTFSLPVVVGDTIRATYATSGGTSTTYVTGSLCFMPDDPTVNAMVAMMGIGTATDGTVEYNFPRGAVTNWSPTESGVIYRGGVTDTTFTGMVAQVSAAPGTGKSYTFTLRKNGADTAIALTIADAATTGQMTGGPVVIQSGDTWNLAVVASGNPASPSAENAVTLPGAPAAPPVISRHNLLTGDSHTVTGSDNLIVGTLGTVDEADLVALFSLDGSAHAEDRDHTFCVHADNICLNGDVTINGDPIATGAPADAQYVTLASDATLTNERVLTAGAGISLTDAGAGSTVTIAATGSSAWTEVVASADQDVSSNATVADDAELMFDMAAAALYEWEALLAYSSPVGGGTPDFRVAWNGPATLTGQWNSSIHALTPAEAQGGFATTGLTTLNSYGTATTPRIIRCFGWAYSTGGGTGASGFRLQWSQATSNGNATRRHAGSILSYRQIL